MNTALGYEMFAESQEQHRWLEQLVGQWRVEQECMESDKKTLMMSDMVCRMIGGLWLVSENTGQSEKGGVWICIMTLGYDPQQNAYHGTFVGSMMTHLWQYRGQVDATGRRLPLATRGPRLEGSGQANYRDTVEIVSADKWLFTGEMQQEDGAWKRIMHSTHSRI